MRPEGGGNTLVIAEKSDGLLHVLVSGSHVRSVGTPPMIASPQTLDDDEQEGPPVCHIKKSTPSGSPSLLQSQVRPQQDVISGSPQSGSSTGQKNAWVFVPDRLTTLKTPRSRSPIL